MVSYQLTILYSAVALSIITGVLVAVRREDYAWIPAIILLMPDLIISPGYLMYPVLVDLTAISNILALKIMNSRIRGFDYAILSFIGLITAYVMYVPYESSSIGITAYFGSMIGLFAIVSASMYFIIQAGSTVSDYEAAVKAIVALVIATVLFFVGSTILLLAYLASFKTPSLYMVGYLIALLGLMLEVGAAPMHIWVPDALTALNPIVASIVASISKIMPFIAFVKLTYPIMEAMGPQALNYAYWLTGVMAMLSMFIGNIGALTARENARVLAYSSIANMGYVLAALAAVFNSTTEAALAYAIAGLITQLIVNASGKVGLFTAISNNNRGGAYSYILAFSFIGVPPLLGFWSKLFIVLSLALTGPLGIWLAIILVVNSVISVPYYVRLSRELSLKGIGGYTLATILLTTLIMLTGVVIVIPAAIVEYSHLAVGLVKIPLS